MAGPYTGTWRRTADVRYTGALKQGTGINPVHYVRTIGPNVLRPKQTYETPDMGAGQSTDRMIDDTDYPELIEGSSEFWGINSETGLRDHPNYQEVGDANTAGSRSSLQQPDWPPWGGSRKTMPGGNFIRSILKGALATNRSREVPTETVSEGWENKPKGHPADSEASDNSQLTMNTSEVQRYKVRAGSQSGGRASEFVAPIESRVVGAKVKQYSDSDNRRWDMTPYEQEDLARPFLSRQVGTGYQQWNVGVNDMFVQSPLMRQPAPDPEQGDVSPNSGNPFDYSYEDRQYY